LTEQGFFIKLPAVALCGLPVHQSKIIFTPTWAQLYQRVIFGKSRLLS
jgi:hypothetical protein